MPATNSAARVQPTRSISARTRRLRNTALGVVIGAAVMLPAGLIGAPGVAAHGTPADGRDCRIWTSTTTPPDYVRVLRNQSGRVDRVPFQRYVTVVLSKEWPSYLPQAVVEAGAVAVKQYAWFHALGQPRRTSDGRCFDVRDGVSDQLYKPHRARVRQDHHAAVAKTWNVTLYKHGQLFMTGYRRGHKCNCGHDSTGWKLFARSATRCAYNGHDYIDILRIYYGPGLKIVS